MKSRQIAFCLLIAVATLAACQTNPPASNPAPGGPSAAVKPLPANEAELLRVAGTGDLTRVKQLLEQGTNPNVKDSVGRTPLIEASYNGHADVVEALKKAGAKMPASYQDREALFKAAATGNNDQINALLAKGIDVNTRDEAGRSALTEAVYAGKADTVKLLLEKGADPNAKKIDGATPLGFATNGKRPDIAEMLRKAGAK